tara:strand:+ start:675 stop:1481 length:807 start_codon:yes stop_codon:yes gene_type:complete
MPFKSEKQRRYLFANEPEIARDWTDTYGSKIQAADGGIMRIPFANGREAYGASGQYGGGSNPSGQDRGRETYGSQTQYGSNPNRTTTRSGDTYASDDPTLEEKTDFVGMTAFGPTQKYTGRGSFFGGANKYGYTDQYVDPTRSNFGQLKPGYGGRIVGGLMSLLTGVPFVGSALGRAYDYSKGMFRDKYYDDMSKYSGLGLYDDRMRQRAFYDDALYSDNYSDMKIPGAITEVDDVDEEALEAYTQYRETTPDDPISFEEFLTVTGRI